MKGHHLLTPWGGDPCAQATKGRQNGQDGGRPKTPPTVDRQPGTLAFSPVSFPRGSRDPEVDEAGEEKVSQSLT